MLFYLLTLHSEYYEPLVNKENRTMNLPRMKVIKRYLQFDFVIFIDTCGNFCMWTTLLRNTLLMG